MKYLKSVNDIQQCIRREQSHKYLKTERQYEKMNINRTGDYQTRLADGFEMMSDDYED
jgi:hypothetical protein